MADEREVTIKISSKNLTGPEFEAVKKSIAGVKAETDRASDSLDTRLLGGLKTMSGLVGVGFGVSAVTNFTSKILDAASAVNDKSKALGFSAEAYQRNAYAAEQSGASEEIFTKAAGILNDKLAGGDKSTVAALRAVGLEHEKIRAMKPEDAWAAVTNAVGQTEDPMLRFHAAQDLVGKGASQLLPGMIEGYDKLRAAATVMSDETVARLEAAQDAWDDFGNKITILSAETAGTIAKAWTDDLKLVWLSLTGGLEEAAIAEGKVRIESKALEEQQKKTAEETRKHAAAQAEIEEKHKKAAEATKKHTEEVNRLGQAYSAGGLQTQVTQMIDKLRGVELQGGFTKEGLSKFGKELDTLHKQGAKLPAVLDDIRISTQMLAFQAKVGGDHTQILTKGIKDSTEAAIGAAPPFETLGVKVGGAYQFLRQIGDFAIDPDKLKPPPEVPSAWDAYKDSAMGAIDSIEGRAAESVVSLIGHWSHHTEVAKQLWADIDAEWRRLLTDFVYDLEHRFVQGMINVFTGNEAGFVGAFSGMFGKGAKAGIATAGTEIALGAPAITTAAGTSGGAAGIAWGAGFQSVLNVAVPLAISYAISRWGGMLVNPIGNIIFGGIGGGSGTGDQRQDPGSAYDPNDPNNPYGDYDPGNPDKNNDGVDDREQGYTQGYATGGIAEGRQLAWIAERGRKEIVGDVEFMKRALTGAIQSIGPYAQPASASSDWSGGSGGVPTEVHNHIYLEGGVVHQSQMAYYRRDQAARVDMQRRLAEGR